MTRIFGNIPDLAGNIPDLVGRGPEYYQWLLVIFRTSLCEVRNVTSSYW